LALRRPARNNFDRRLENSIIRAVLLPTPVSPFNSRHARHFKIQELPTPLLEIYQTKAPGVLALLDSDLAQEAHALQRKRDDLFDGLLVAREELAALHKTKQQALDILATVEEQAEKAGKSVLNCARMLEDNATEMVENKENRCTVAFMLTHTEDKPYAVQPRALTRQQMGLETKMHVEQLSLVGSLKKLYQLHNLGLAEHPEL